MATKLTQAVSDAQTFLLLADTTDFPQNGVVQIESELILYTHATDLSVLNCTRGYLGTSAASHAVNTAVSLYTSLPSASEDNSVLSLLSPASITSDLVDKTDIIAVSTVLADSLTLVLPNPTDETKGRVLTVSHVTGSAGSLTVNGTSIAASESISFTWNGDSWTSPHDATGGGGITQLTGDVTAGPGTGSQAATLADTAVTPGAYTAADITVDSKGRITAAANGSASPSFPLLAPDGSDAAPSYSFSSAPSGLFLENPASSAGNIALSINGGDALHFKGDGSSVHLRGNSSIYTNGISLEHDTRVRMIVDPDSSGSGIEVNFTSGYIDLSMGSTELNISNNSQNMTFYITGTEVFKLDTTTIKLENPLTLSNQSSTTGAQAATLTNSPVMGDPAGWLQIMINGTPSYIPFWQ